MGPHSDSVQAHARSSAISSTIFAVNLNYCTLTSTRGRIDQSERREIRTLSESMYFNSEYRPLHVKIVNIDIYKQSISWNEIVFGGVFCALNNVANLECYFVRNVLFKD